MTSHLFQPRNHLIGVLLLKLKVAPIKAGRGKAQQEGGIS